MGKPDAVNPSTLHQGVIAYVGSEIDSIYTSEISSVYKVEESNESSTSAGILASVLNGIGIEWRSGRTETKLKEIADEDLFKAKKLSEKFLEGLDSIPRLEEIENIDREEYPEDSNLGGHYFKYHGDISLSRAESGDLRLTGDDGNIEFITHANPENFSSGSYQTVADTGGKTYEMTGICYPKRWNENDNGKYPVKFIILWAP